MKRTLLSLAIGFSILAAACQRRNESHTVSDNGNFRIGVFADLTGRTSSAGQAMRNSIELAKDEINQSGGINGRQLEVILEDDKGDPNEAAAALDRLVGQNKVHAVIGEPSAPGNLMAAPKAQGAHVPMLSLSATERKITQAGDYIFRMAVLNSIQGEQMGSYAANNIKAKTAAILSEEGSDYSNELAQSFEQAFAKLGGQINVKQSYTPAGQSFTPQLTAIQAANPDVIYIPGRYDQVGLIAKEAKRLGLKSILLGASAWNDPKLFELGGGALDGAYISGEYSADDPSQTMRSFTSAYKKRYGQAPDHAAALAYDATKLLIDALKRVGSADSAKLRDAIAQTSRFPGITGVITFDADRNASKPATIFKLQEGKIIPVFRAEP